MRAMGYREEEETLDTKIFKNKAYKKLLREVVRARKSSKLADDKLSKLQAKIVSFEARFYGKYDR